MRLMNSYKWGETMSSSEEYLDSLLDSILGGGKSDGEEEAASGMDGGDNPASAADGGKAMSSQEIEELPCSCDSSSAPPREPIDTSISSIS